MPIWWRDTCCLLQECRVHHLSEWKQKCPSQLYCDQLYAKAKESLLNLLGNCQRSSSLGERWMCLIHDWADIQAEANLPFRRKFQSHFQQLACRKCMDYPEMSASMNHTECWWVAMDDCPLVILSPPNLNCGHFIAWFHPFPSRVAPASTVSK